ncbi:hypothetical protein QVD17_18317 [Tagetes erecta]|uniref:Uncharacterized protein n=1 Tax=Tagetes erecta TaxID=13708 RepID=A0AAD8KHW1_TARER|nr:hypothetical protein QVD17_18317 [Tagetes erecta]
MEINCKKFKRKSFSIDWNQLLSDFSDEDHEINKSTVRLTKTSHTVGVKLPDKGKKFKASICRLERELQRRNKLQSHKVDKGCEETIQLSDHTNYGASHGKKKSASTFVNSFGEKMEEDVLFCTIPKKQIITNDDKKDNDDSATSFSESNSPQDPTSINLKPQSADKICEEKMQLSDHDDAGVSLDKKQSASKSQDGVAINSSTHDSLTDETMQKIVNELVKLGISPFDLGKAAEVCYRDPVKVKVLFALPTDMRRSYVFRCILNIRANNKIGK